LGYRVNCAPVEHLAQPEESTGTVDLRGKS
jgi:hypothetical protein